MSPAGFQDGYPYPHAHTLYILECGEGPKLKEEQVCAKMIMFAFGNALAHAHALNGVRHRWDYASGWRDTVGYRLSTACFTV